MDLVWLGGLGLSKTTLLDEILDKLEIVNHRVYGVVVGRLQRMRVVGVCIIIGAGRDLLYGVVGGGGSSSGG